MQQNQVNNQFYIKKANAATYLYDGRLEKVQKGVPLLQNLA